MMKTIGENRNPAAICLQQTSLAIPDTGEIQPNIPPIQSIPQELKKNNIIGLSEDVRIRMLTSENQRLKDLVESLVTDKQYQARRIMELNEEKSRLKKTLADVIIGGENGKTVND